MILYRIRNWSEIYENNRTRELKTLNWIPIPNKQDGDGYTAILSLKDGPAIYGAFVAIASIASRCDPRGTLLRDTGKPHTAASLSRMSRFPEAVIQRALECLSTTDINWLVAEPYTNLAVGCDDPAVGCDPKAAPPCASRARAEGKGTEENGMEGKGQNGSREVLLFLNSESGFGYRETETNLKFIAGRLSESGVTIEGVKQMVTRQTKLWKGTDMERYLRPETLFNKTKFDAYYAMREAPIKQNDTNPTHSAANRGSARAVAAERNSFIIGADEVKRRIEQEQRDLEAGNVKLPCDDPEYSAAFADARRKRALQEKAPGT